MYLNNFITKETQTQLRLNLIWLDLLHELLCFHLALLKVIYILMVFITKAKV